MLSCFPIGDSNIQESMDSKHENTHAHSLCEGPQTYILYFPESGQKHRELLTGVCGTSAIIKLQEPAPLIV